MVFCRISFQHAPSHVNMVSSSVMSTVSRRILGLRAVNERSAVLTDVRFQAVVQLPGKVGAAHSRTGQTLVVLSLQSFGQVVDVSSGQHQDIQL